MFSNPKHQNLLHFWQELLSEGLQETLRGYSKPANLYHPIRYFLESEGKRLRPLMCLAAAHFTKGLAKDALPAALAIELFHNFSLVHDDIMDEAPLRRGKPSLHEAYGLPAGILCGDRLMVLAWQALEKAPNHALPLLLNRFNTIAAEVCEGQQFDMDFERQSEASGTDYLHMIRLKTAVLLGFSLEAGAISAGAPRETSNALYGFGTNLGLAFQIKDDWLDAFGQSKTVGKKIGGDIRARKKTWLSIQAAQQAPEAFSAADALPDENRIEATLELYKTLNIDQQTLELANTWKQKAIESLKSVGFTPEDFAFFEDFAAYLVDRTY